MSAMPDLAKHMYGYQLTLRILVMLTDTYLKSEVSGAERRFT